MGIINIVLPKLGESIMEATIIKWQKNIGDYIKKDENLVVIATDKVDTEIPCSHGGIVKELLVKENEVIAIGSVIAIIETEDNTLIDTENQSQNQTIDPHKKDKIESYTSAIPYLSNKENEDEKNTTNISSQNKFYSPLVLNIAQQEKIHFNELEKINGTGNEGRVTKNDILNYIKNKKSKTEPLHSNSTLNFSPPESNKILFNKENGNVQVEASAGSNNLLEEIINFDRVRKIIANNMIDSLKTSPHVTSFIEIDVTNLLNVKDKLKGEWAKKDNLKLTLTPLFIDCLLKTLIKYPILNSSIIDDKIIIKKYYNIGMATALPNGNLIVPVIKNANDLSLIGLAKVVNNLADLARKNQLSPDDIKSGTFTLSNIGSYGSLMGTPIILQPQVAILALGQIKKRVVVIEDEKGDSIGIRQMMFASLSYDHRIIDGALASRFLSDFSVCCRFYN